MEGLRERTDRSGAVEAGPGLAVKLNDAVAAVKASVGPESPLVARCTSLRNRLEGDRLQLAVLGQFKRGKSTFINALLGAPVLPIAVVPLTAVPIFISWASEPLSRVRFLDSREPEQIEATEPNAIRDFLFRFVAEEANPKNRLGVARVDLFYPAPILADGIVLIDTPGVGSTFHHNTEAALQVIPECDAVLFVASTDPPITQTELDYLRRLKSKTERIFFILNKADYIGATERKNVAQFLRKVLEENGLFPPGSKIFPASARNGLIAKQNGDPKQLDGSGIAAIEAHLVLYLETEKARLLEAAIRSKVDDLLSQAEAEVRLRLQALKTPLEDLASKSQAFEHALRAIEEQRRITRDLLAGDQRRLRDDLEAAIHALRKDAGAKFAGTIEERIANFGRWDEAAQQVLSAAMQNHFEKAQQEFGESYSDKANTLLSRHQGRINELVELVRRTAADIFNVPFSERLEHDRFQLGQDPYWVTENIKATLIPDPSRLIDPFLPNGVRMKRLLKRILKNMQELVMRNAENLRWAILRGIDETFRRAGARFDGQLDDAIKATRNVIGEALARRRDTSFAVEPEVIRLDRSIERLSEVRKSLAG
jgi:Dynamin family